MATAFSGHLAAAGRCTGFDSRLRFRRTLAFERLRASRSGQRPVSERLEGIEESLYRANIEIDIYIISIYICSTKML